MKKILIIIAFFAIQSCSKQPLSKAPNSTPTNPIFTPPGYVSIISQNLDLKVYSTKKIDSVKFTLYDSVNGNTNVIMLDTMYRKFNTVDSFTYYITNGYSIKTIVYLDSPAQAYLHIYNHNNKKILYNDFKYISKIDSFTKILTF